MKEQWGRLWGNKEEKSRELEKIISVPVASIVSNPYQPRKHFEKEKIEELARSINTYGLLQPIILNKKDNNTYQIAAGERRFLACTSLGWKDIPAIVREYQSSTLAAVAMIENLQRENLDFVEEALGYRLLIEEFNLTQEVLAQRLGKSQSTIANKLRILNLPDDVLDELKKEDLTERHARALLKLKDSEKQRDVLRKIVNLELNVKDTEELIDMLTMKEELKPNQQKGLKKVVIRDMRIFLNTIRQAVKIIENAGLSPHVEESEDDDSWEIRIRLQKKN